MEKLVVCYPSTNNYYNTACLASLAGDEKKGFAYLQEAINRGYSDSLHMAQDEDLAYLRSLKGWKQTAVWMAEVRNRLYKEIAKIHVACPAADLIPYKVDNKWGYVDRKTKHKITEPIFRKASFVGKTGSVVYGEREILFDCSGKILKDEVYMMPDGAAYYPRYTSSQQLKKGFRTKNGKITEYASIYQEFIGISVNYGQLYAIVEITSGKYALIDSTGTEVTGSNNCKKLEFYNYGMDSEYYPDDDKYNDFFIFYIDSMGNAGLLNNTFEKIPLVGISDFQKPVGNGFEREYLHLIRDYVYLKKGNKWGLWNSNTKKWVIEPEYDEIQYTERTYDGNYEDDYYTGNTIALYFMVKQNGREFFIDKENVKYIPE